MTCIVGLVAEDGVYIGGDSAGVAGYDVTIRADTKVFQNKDYLMGFCGSFRMGQLLRCAFNPPQMPYCDTDGNITDIYNFMVTDFIDAVRQCLKNGGCAQKHNDAEYGGTFLVAYKGRLFTIENDYQVGESIYEYNAIGCGDMIALGSLHSTRDLNDPEKRVLMALEAAEEFSGGVRSPFVIKKLPKGEV